MRLNKKYLWIISILIFAFYENVQSQIVSFVRYSVENGMAQSQVQTITQDDFGQLWVGTINGISVYDGVAFTNYGVKDGMAEDWVTSSFKDLKGNLWFGHWGGGISKFGKETQAFENINIQEFNEFQSISNFISVDSSSFLFTSLGSGLFLYNIETNKVSKIVYSQTSKSRYITIITKDAKGNLWLGTEEDGVYIFSTSEILSDNITAENITQVEGLSSNQVTSVLEFEDGIWIATKNHGINIIKNSNVEDFLNTKNKVLKIRYLAGGKDLISSNINCMMVDHLNQMWIGTNDQGIQKFETIEGVEYSKPYTTAQGLSFYSINTMFLDSENGIWIGTNVGLNQFISDYFLLYDESVGLINNMIWSIANDGQGNIYLGTNNGISVLENADNFVNDDDIAVRNIDIDGITNVPVNAMFRDSENSLWFATAVGSLYKKTPKGGFEKINIESVFKDIIFSIAEDNSGNIWIGTRAGVARINKNNKRLRFFSDEDGLVPNNIRKIAKDSKGNLWFGGLGGIAKYDGEKFESIKVTEDDKSLVVLSIAVDTVDNVWFGSYTGGLYKYDGKTVTNYNKEDGMTSETPYALAVDQENDIWIGTTFGIERFDQASQRFSHYSRSEGFLGVEVNPNAMTVDENFNIWFGTILGAVKYNPNSDAINKAKPVAILRSLQINLEPAEFPFDAEFMPEENNLTFEYIGVSLNNSNKVRYEYMLEGIDNRWKETSSRDAFYSNLDPGKYKFILKAFNADDIESDTIEYAFRIETPFYDSYWFYGIQIFIIIIMLVLAVFYGRKTGGSRVATVLASVAIIIGYEYGVNYAEDSLEDVIGNVAFIKVGLNAMLGFLLFPVETFIKKVIVKADEITED